MRAIYVFGALLPGLALAQDAAKPAASSFDNLLSNLPPRCVGPTIMGGRTVDISVYEKEPRIFYVATAGGGLWKTENGGITLKPVYDHGPTSAMGCVAVSQSDPNMVYLGTGEATSRNSLSWGDGLYKSTDGGKTWASIGLKDSKHIAKILIDPKNSDTVYVGALGHLWGKNNERGIYKSTDGGKSWNRQLYVDDKTGCIDLIMDPSNSSTLIAAMYERMRYPWTYISGGPGSGIYKSTDAGKTWRKLAKGLPTTNMGRIGLNYFRKNSKVVIATIENKEAGGLYRSTDGGESWTKVNTQNPRPFYFSIPRQDPLDENRIYVPGVNMLFSEDAGKTVRPFRTSVHVDHHAMWIDPSDSNHMLIGEDGGLAQTRDRGVTWEHLNYMPIGQFYDATFDMRKPYWVYGGLQDNGSWAGPTQTSRNGVAFWDWYNIGGGDGFHVQVDPNDWTTAYSESQGGAIGRFDQVSGQTRFIQPGIKGEKLRFNWSTPFILSPFNSKTIYLGANRLMKSVNRGDTWKPVSPDLTTNDPEKQKPGVGSVTPENTGAEVHCSIITVSESPMKQGVLWVGTDDGQVQVSQDDGANWSNVTANVPEVPKNTWCSRVTASKYVEGRCYITFDGHRLDNYNPYVFVTEDFGKTWKRINSGIPVDHTCLSIKEGLKNENLLYLGTEQGLWMSFDRGTTWTQYKSPDFPTVPVHDIAIHPRDGDLIIATHGRSIWTLPVAALEEMTAENLAKDVVIAKPQPVYLLGRVDGPSWDGDRVWLARNTQPGSLICYYCKADMGDAKVTITDAAGNSVADLSGSAKPGLNTVTWNVRGRRRVTTGEYRVTLKVKDKEYITTVTVEDLFPSSQDGTVGRGQDERRREEEEEGGGGRQ